MEPYEFMPREYNEVKEDKTEESKDKFMNEVEMISCDQDDELEDIETETKEEIEKNVFGASHLKEEHSVILRKNAI